MAVSLALHTDAALTVPVATYHINHVIVQSNDPQDFLFYLGSTESANKFENVNDPGVDDLLIEVVNATPLWLASTAVIVNDTARTTAKNRYRYKVLSIAGGGVTGASEPTWPTMIGATVVDNEVTWINDGKLHESTEFKIATTLIGLDTAVAGDPVNLGTVINGGSGNAVTIYLRASDATKVISQVTELSIAVNDVIETPI